MNGQKRRCYVVDCKCSLEKKFYSEYPDAVDHLYNCDSATMVFYERVYGAPLVVLDKQKAKKYNLRYKPEKTMNELVS